ncbi:AAA family ATPase [Herbivorax sp. ANBcel31]|uniref:AAA family ATPase n=1 Tax=Herbivorax sp. ANBcel31 TaxID=3069754 RepID=UPI0027B4A64A|nr:AAA family ATPase [Herbivorax sp. ANBcel31]MDQ2088048.1 AAA family ATPase [Herbivorax sp. ANBcel31]
MYLKSLKIKNFRKFGEVNNKIEFVDAKCYHEQKDSKNINVAPTTTLIVGKNNCGKTTIVKLLEKLIINKSFKSNDFNFLYLKKVLKNYKEAKESGKSLEKIKSPYLEFNICIGIEDNKTDLITNLIPFLSLDDIEKTELGIIVKYELEEEEAFKIKVLGMIENISQSSAKEEEYFDIILFREFLDLIDNSNFKIYYYDSNGNKVDKFNIDNLIDIKTINANNIKNEKCLSEAFSRIIKYRYNSIVKDESKTEEKLKLDSSIRDFNIMLTSKIEENHTNAINESLGKIESSDKFKVCLTSDLSFQKLINNLIRYEYVEQDNNIPENQFGLGYTNLMMIIGDLIEYIEKYPEDSFNSKVNIISIEEPETFMHPQMQELFIKNINNAIDFLLKSKNKNINSQLIITTHSSHILNSKIHSGNTFNNINYINIKDNYAYAINLNDEKIMPDETDDREKDLKFLKKHIKYKVSELFFSDGIIFVEGVTEETLLKYYIENNSKLNKYYISIFNIDGAHGLVYHKLIKLLEIPALIITDLDIKRGCEEKKSFEQITDLKNKETTNKTIKNYNNNSNSLESLHDNFHNDNLYITWQGKINGYYASSFEEAYILTNYNNRLLNEVLEGIKPKIYSGIIGKDEKYKKIRDNSYKFQSKLSNCKSDFANALLYKFTTEGENLEIPVIPTYIDDGLDWLAKKIKEEEC